MAPVKQFVEFRGQMCTYQEVALALGLSVETVKYRVMKGSVLDAPRHHRNGSVDKQERRVPYRGELRTYREIASLTGLPAATIKSRYHNNIDFDAPLWVPSGKSADRIEARTVDATTPYDDDHECQRLVHEHPNGMKLEEIGKVMGVTRERVRQIERRALRKLFAIGVTSLDIMRMRHCADQLDEIKAHRNTRFNPTISGVHYIVPPTALPTGRRSRSA